MGFLTIWFIGDVANFVGSVWAGLVPTVIALAAYFCVADAVLVTQCLFYDYVNGCRQPKDHSAPEQRDNPSRPLLTPISKDVGLPGSRRRSSASQERPISGLTTSRSSIVRENRRVLHNVIPILSSVFAVCIFGALGWLVAWKIDLWKPISRRNESEGASYPRGAEVLGYVSAVLYLG